MFMCDFETTVYDNQDHTEVWAVAIVELFTENVTILHCIEDMFTYFRALDTNIIAFFHNLKFDGAFILDYLIAQKKYPQALNNDNGVYHGKRTKKSKLMKYVIVSLIRGCGIQLHRNFQTISYWNSVTH